MKCYFEKYASFKVGDFVEDRDFRLWVLTPNEETNAFWLSFLQQYPHQSSTVTEARNKLQESTNKQEELTAIEKKELRMAIFDELQLSSPKVNKTAFLKNVFIKWLGVAAISLSLAGGVTWLLSKQHTVTPDHYTYKTAPREVKEIVLPDSSVVILNGNSSIVFDTAFLQLPQREIHLSGNAYFKVKKTTDERPFIVYTNQLTIHVIGTEFNVDARSTTTDVVLTKGNIDISLAENQHNASTTSLKAGEKFRMDTTTHTYITEKTNTDLYAAAWEKGEWHFDSIPLEQIATLIQQFYGTVVTFKNPDSAKLTISAVLSVDNLSTLIHVIEKTLNLTIDETPDTLIIH